MVPALDEDADMPAPFQATTVATTKDVLALIDSQ
jgi:hypothetical protein